MVAAFVVAMILVGGATRLTDSGLSITEWDLEKGLIPPLTAERWTEEFRLYQQTMEYQAQNFGMSLSEFQHIYLWEWGHRFLGKVLGVVFTLPALFFLLTGRLRGRFRVTGLLFVLGASQGAIGWWMVTSGLFDRLDVSPVRLAIHLGMALIILALLLWVAIGALGAPRDGSKLGVSRVLALFLIACVFMQAMFGALMAGADGGPAYADWPRIGGEWIPSSAFGLEPIWHNFTEDHATQHLVHRTFGYVVALLALVIGGYALARGQGAARIAGSLVGAVALVQVLLGVLTVLAASPLSLSLMHQAGAVALWIAAVTSARLAWR